VILKRGQHSKYLPFAFTEQGVAMLSSVLNSDRAIEVKMLQLAPLNRVPFGKFNRASANPVPPWRDCWVSERTTIK
jgi:hypothetical protein